MNSEFIKNENIEMLWEIIYDNIKEQIKIQEQMFEIQKFFLENIRIFFDRERMTPVSLIILNKKFISEIIQKIQEKIQEKTQKINLFEDQNKSYTVKEIHADRKKTFEKILEEKKKDFENTKAISVPEKPKFSDKMDEPIGDMMSDLIAKTIAQRNYELENIHNNINKEEVQKFLNTKNIKKDKLLNETISTSQIQNKYLHQDTPKLIKIGEYVPSEIIKKQVSWGENKNVEFDEVNIDFNESEKSFVSKTTNIFSKLKTIETNYDEIDTIKVEIKNIKSQIDMILEKVDKIIYFNENKIEK